MDEFTLLSEKLEAEAKRRALKDRIAARIGDYRDVKDRIHAHNMRAAFYPRIPPLERVQRHDKAYTMDASRKIFYMRYRRNTPKPVRPSFKI